MHTLIVWYFISGLATMIKVFVYAFWSECCSLDTFTTVSIYRCADVVREKFESEQYFQIELQRSENGLLTLFPKECQLIPPAVQEQIAGWTSSQRASQRED